MKYEVISQPECYKYWAEIFPATDKGYWISIEKKKRLPFISQLIIQNGLEPTQTFYDGEIILDCHTHFGGLIEIVLPFFRDKIEKVLVHLPMVSAGVFVPTNEMLTFFCEAHYAIFNEFPDLGFGDTYFLDVEGKDMVTFEHPGIISFIKSVPS